MAGVVQRSKPRLADGVRHDESGQYRCVMHASAARKPLAARVTVLAYAGAPSTCAPDTERISRRSDGWWAAWPRTIRVYARWVAGAVSCRLARYPARSIRSTGKGLRMVTASRHPCFVRAPTAGLARADRTGPGRSYPRWLRCIGNTRRSQKRGRIHIHRLFRGCTPFLIDSTHAMRVHLAPQGFSSSYSDVLGCHTKRPPFSLCSFLDRHAW